jgi:hypothetical protein
VSVSAAPETTPAAPTFDLSAAIADDGASAPIAFDWHLVGGSVGRVTTEPTMPNATFVCTAIGAQTVELTITGGDPTAACASSARVSFDCTSLCGNGIVDPGETCDSPDPAECDVTCHKVNHCPIITSVVPTDPVIHDGASTIVTVVASDPDPGDSLLYQWSADNVSTSTDSVAATSYTCTQPGIQTIRIGVSDGQCMVGSRTQVTCLGACGNGVVELGEECDPPHTGPEGLQCGPTCQLLTCGNGVINPGEQCDPPLPGVCASTCQTVQPPLGCGNGVIDPGEACDPPDDTTCDRACQAIPIVCGNGIQQPGEQCDIGATSPVMCRDCKVTNCGGCFGAVGGGGNLCRGLNVADTQACNALVTCAANSMAWCANATAVACYCADAAQTFASTCPKGGDGPCGVQFQMLAHSSDPAVVLAQIKDPSTPVGQVGAAMHKFANSSCGATCHIYNN